MRNRIFQAVVIWKDGEVEDADELVVYAPTAAGAEREARKRWRLTVGVRWPSCVVQEVTVTATSGRKVYQGCAPPV
jgi:hypothetical protein